MSKATIGNIVPTFRVSTIAQILFCYFAVPGAALADPICIPGDDCIVSTTDEMWQLTVSESFTLNSLTVGNGRYSPSASLTINGTGVNSGAVYADTIMVGVDSVGTLIVDNGALVNSSDFIKIGVGAAGRGNVILDNGASLFTTGELSFGVYGSTGGSGVMHVNNRASVSANTIRIGGSNSQSNHSMLTVSNDGTIFASDSIEIRRGILNIGASAREKAVEAGDVSATGGVILADSSSVVNFNHTDTDYVFSPMISGNGFVTVNSGHTTLDNLNTYAGYTIVQGGTLQAGTEGAFSQNADYFMTQKGILDLNGISQTIGSYSSSGTTYFNHNGDSAGTELTVSGDYHGYGGTLVFNTVLEGDDSVTDKLTVLGNADGGTNVIVNNIGGKGSQTVEGIELITVEGEIAEGTEFRQNGRIVAGAYDYRLIQGGDGGSNSSWYLTSGAGGVDPIDPIDPIDPELPEPPILPEVPDISISRPEAGSYIANLAASEMFFTRLEDRGREHFYTDILTGEKKKTSMWLRSEGRHLDSNDSSGQLSTRENRYSIQIGGDMTNGSFTGTDNWRLGLMTGYGNSHSNTRSDITGYQSKGDVDGYTMGLYGSWFENADRRSGAWVDTWLQYAWFSNSVQGDGLALEKYDSDGLQASVETGYAFVLSGGKSVDYIIEPQAQVIWNGVKADEHRESNGTVVSSDGTNNVHTRLGVKGAMEIHTGGESDAVWKPYIALSWHHNKNEYGVKMDDITLSTSGAKNTGELKVGVEGQLTPQLSVWGGASGQAGSDDYRDLGGFLGVRWFL